MSIHFRDRIYQRSLNDTAIYPQVSKSFIAENFACQKGKGTKAARDRLKDYLHQFYDEYKTDGYVLKIDIKGYYPNMEHEFAEKMLKGYIDDGTYDLAQKVLARLPGEVGYNPGSQIVQIVGITALDKIDHYIKEKLQIKYYIRYMDDGHAEGSKAEMLALRGEIARAAESLGFRLHEAKTAIVKMSRGFMYLKIRYSVTDSGHIIRRMARSGIVRMRRKMKRLRGLWLKGRVTLDDIFLSVKSWLGNVKKYCHGYRTRKRILNLYYSLFRGYRMEGAIA